jgi:hypothetical protein
MKMGTQTHNLKEYKSHTTFEGIKFTLPEGDLYNLQYAAAIMQVRKSSGTPVMQQFRPGDGTMVINVEQRTITIPPQIIKLAAGTYMWDLRIRFQDQREKIYVEGKWVIQSYISAL